ncbi:hypothetical protein [Agromyces seonyuensis]|uniref:Uncharacterized protein n=1 Tax=Agromyces seonyuensis TaxID=2662446 RepID=A0A6I4NV62_9MICO|nr:hypothetical protein [Agromyces seonyuensis]MWB98268.1 hypothetical protein [Agromyces seonyuensis]
MNTTRTTQKLIALTSATGLVLVLSACGAQTEDAQTAVSVEDHNVQVLGGADRYVHSLETQARMNRGNGLVSTADHLEIVEDTAERYVQSLLTLHEMAVDEAED